MRNSWRPTRRQLLIAGGLTSAGAVCAGGALGFAAKHGMKTAERAGLAFGTTVKLKAMHHDEAVLNAALDAAWQQIAGVEESASLFRSDSALSRLNREGIIDTPSFALFDMMRFAQRLSRETNGAFEVTVQPLWDVYAAAAEQGRTPSDSELNEVRPFIGSGMMAVRQDRIEFQHKGKMAVTLNGVAQGYATQLCLDALAAHGVRDAFLNTGEIGVSGKRDGMEPWTAAIADPRNENGYVALTQPLSGVLATSGDYATHFTDDFATHHIFDPQTLQSPVEMASVSVLAKSGLLADALSTAMMVMGPERSLEAAKQFGVEVLIITKAGKHLRTAGFPIV